MVWKEVGKKFSFALESQAKKLFFFLGEKQFNTSLSKLAYEEVDFVHILIKTYKNYSSDLAVGFKKLRTFS